MPFDVLEHGVFQAFLSVVVFVVSVVWTVLAAEDGMGMREGGKRGRRFIERNRCSRKRGGVSQTRRFAEEERRGEGGSTDRAVREIRSFQVRKSTLEEKDMAVYVMSRTSEEHG